MKTVKKTQFTHLKQTLQGQEVVWGTRVGKLQAVYIPWNHSWMLESLRDAARPLLKAP